MLTYVYTGGTDDACLWASEGGGDGVGGVGVVAVALRVLDAEVRNAMGQRRQAIDMLYHLLALLRERARQPQGRGAGGGQGQGVSRSGGGGGCRGHGEEEKEVKKQGIEVKEAKAGEEIGEIGEIAWEGREAGLSLLHAQPHKTSVDKCQRYIIAALVPHQKALYQLTYINHVITYILFFLCARAFV
jgi:hypothetical protein